MVKYDAAVIGGGASGIAAAISAARSGKRVILLEKGARLGKKILASGNGRCNLANENLSEEFYNASARTLVKSVFSVFGRDDILGFFKRLGLETYSDEGRIFPVTNQASSVLKVLEMELERLSVPYELNFAVSSITSSAKGFVVKAADKEIICDKVIIACGGSSYPAFGSDGRSYRFAEEFGHPVVAPVPSAVPLTAKDTLCHLLQGQKIFASVKSFSDGKFMNEAKGELLFTKYGLSGTAILDVSDGISIAMNRENKKDIYVTADMVPFMEEGELKSELSARMGRIKKAEDILAGILPNKFGGALKKILETRDINKITEELKNRGFNVSGTRGWNEAEFTSGGIAVNEVREDTLESKLRKGLYFSGEILDVDGKRGGYNLAWAWASGFVAGALK